MQTDRQTCLSQYSAPYRDENQSDTREMHTHKHTTHFRFNHVNTTVKFKWDSSSGSVVNHQVCTGWSPGLNARSTFKQKATSVLTLQLITPATPKISRKKLSNLHLRYLLKRFCNTVNILLSPMLSSTVLSFAAI